MTKAEVEEQRLTEYVLLDYESLTFAAWWRTLKSDDRVEVQERHGIAGKPSNHSKLFLEFVDATSQDKLAAIVLNSSSSPSLHKSLHQEYKFTRIATPRIGPAISRALVDPLTNV